MNVGYNSDNHTKYVSLNTLRGNKDRGFNVKHVVYIVTTVL